MDIENYRKQCLAEIKAERRKSKKKVRKVSDYDFSQVDSEEDLLETISEMSLTGSDAKKNVPILLDMLTNSSLSGKVRMGAFNQLRLGDFHPVEFAPHKPAYTKALREIAEKAPKELRHTALEQLALDNDRYAQKLLRDGLENIRKPLIPSAKAVQLLSHDDHSSSRKIMRRLAKKATGNVRAEALRALSNDKLSIGMLEGIVSDKKESTTIREIAAMSLKNASPKRFAKAASNLVLDGHDDAKLRATAMSAITHNKDIARIVGKPSFIKSVKSVGSGAKSRLLKNSIRQFQASIRID